MKTFITSLLIVATFSAGLLGIHPAQVSAAAAEVAPDATTYCTAVASTPVKAKDAQGAYYLGGYGHFTCSIKPPHFRATVQLQKQDQYGRYNNWGAPVQTTTSYTDLWLEDTIGCIPSPPYAHFRTAAILTIGNSAGVYKTMVDYSSAMGTNC